MTGLLDEVVERVAAVADASRAGDDEAAHGLNDELRALVLRRIALGEVDLATARQMAEVALSTDQLDFNQWCG